MTQTQRANGNYMLDIADEQASLETIYIQDIKAIDYDAQPRLDDELNHEKIRGIAEEIRQEHELKGTPQERCLKKTPYVQRVGRPGSYRYKRIAGSHRIGAYQLLGWKKIEVKVLDSDFFEKNAISRRLFQIASSPKPLQDGHNTKEIETALFEDWDKAPIYGNEKNALVYLNSCNQHYPVDTYKKIIKAIKKRKEQLNADESEKKTNIRTYWSGKPPKDSDGELRLRYANCWFDEFGDKLPQGRWWKFNASTRNLFDQNMTKVLKNLHEQGHYRDPNTGKYKADRQKQYILFHVEPAKVSNTTKGNVSELINKHLAEMSALIESQDLPIDAIYRYPQFTTQDDLEEAILLWTKKDGKVNK